MRLNQFSISALAACQRPEPTITEPYSREVGQERVQ